MVDPSVSGNHRQIDPVLETSTIRPSTSSFDRSRILFGSCHSQHYYRYNRQHKNESDTLPIWESMSTRNASAMIWVGDAIYGDDFVRSPRSPLFTKTAATETKWYWTKLLSSWNKGKMIIRPATPSILQELYDQLITNSGYMRFTRRNSSATTITESITINSNNNNIPMTVLGVWDDHDYGVNNGDYRYMYRTESAKLYLQFLQRSSSHTALDLRYIEQRARNGKGLYGVKVFDFYQPRGQELLSDDVAGVEWDDDLTEHQQEQTMLSNRSVAIFLLDCRSNKTPWNQTFPNRYQLNYSGDFLGEEQWQWLERSLSRSTASVNIIVQGLQVHADHFFDGNIVEDWSRFPTAQHRLFQTILSSGVAAPILVSGDVHMAELLRRDCRRRHASTTVRTDPTYSASRMLLEVTVSGMTHSWCSNTCARPHLGKICRNRWIQWALCSGMHFAHQTPAWTDVIDSRTATPTTPSSNQYLKHGLQYVLERNFGEMEFDWENRQVLVRVFGHTGKEYISSAWPFDLLSGSHLEPIPTGRLRTSDYERTYKNLFFHNVSQPDDWICLNHRGVSSVGMKLFGVLSPICLTIFLISLPLSAPMMILWIIWRHRKRLYRNETKQKQS